MQMVRAAHPANLSAVCAKPVFDVYLRESANDVSSSISCANRAYIRDTAAMDRIDSRHGHRKRLRQRFITSSLDGFHDYEAVELLLTYAIPRIDVKPIAKDMIRRCGGLKGIFESDINRLAAVPGVGENCAFLFGLVRFIGTACMEEYGSKAGIIRSAKDVVDYIGGLQAAEPSTRFLAVYMNSKNEILGSETISEGEVCASSVSPRKVIENAFKHNARSIIFVHVTPSGEETPTDGERELVKALEDAASTIDIVVHDHIIASRSSYISARDLGWIKGGNG